MIDFVVGFLTAWILRSLLEWRRKHHGGTLGARPLVFNEGRTVRGNGNGGPTTPKPPIKPQPPAGRMIHGGLWREKGSDVWHSLGKEPDWADLARQQLNRTTPSLTTVTVQGLNWPATLGDFTLVGPADNQGTWRWYERQHNGTTERVRVDHQLLPLFPPHLGEP